MVEWQIRRNTSKFGLLRPCFPIQICHSLHVFNGKRLPEPCLCLALRCSWVLTGQFCRRLSFGMCEQPCKKRLKCTLDSFFFWRTIPMKYQSSIEVILEHGYSKTFHDIPIMLVCLSIESPPHFYWIISCSSPLHMLAIWAYISHFRDTPFHSNLLVKYIFLIVKSLESERSAMCLAACIFHRCHVAASTGSLRWTQRSEIWLKGV